MATSLLIKSVDALGSSYQKTITHVNPEATNQQIDTFARTFNNLSTNSYADTIKVTTISINDALAEAAAEGGEG